MPQPQSPGDVGTSTLQSGTHWPRQLLRAGGESLKGVHQQGWQAGRSRRKGGGERCAEQTGAKLEAKDSCSQAAGPLSSSPLPPPPPPPRRPINSRWKDHITGEDIYPPSFHTSSDLFQLCCPAAAAWPCLPASPGEGEGGRHRPSLQLPPPARLRPEGATGPDSGVGRGLLKSFFRRQGLKGTRAAGLVDCHCPLSPGPRHEGCGLLPQGRPSHSDPRLAHR